MIIVVLALGPARDAANFKVDDRGRIVRFQSTDDLADVAKREPVAAG